MSSLPRVTKPATKVNKDNLVAMTLGGVNQAEDPLKGRLAEEVTAKGYCLPLQNGDSIDELTIKGLEKQITCGENPLNATVESDHEDLSIPTVKSTGLSPQIGGKLIPKKKTEHKVTYRDIPNDQIDMNPKSPKKPKRKKSKKGKSSLASPAKVRSPTATEKQTRLVENLRLYNPGFVVGSIKPMGKPRGENVNSSARPPKPLYRLTISEKQSVLLAGMEQYQTSSPHAASISVADMFASPTSQATLFSLVKQHAKDFPLNTFSGKLIKELQKPVVDSEKLVGIIMDAIERMPETKEEMAVAMENLRLYTLVYPQDQYTAHLIEILEDKSRDSALGAMTGGKSAVTDKIRGHLASRSMFPASMKVFAAQGMKPYDQLTTSEQSDVLLQCLQTYHTQFPGNTITAPLVMALLNKPGSVTINVFFNRILDELYTPASTQDGTAFVANVKLYQHLTPENQDLTKSIALYEGMLQESVKEGGMPIMSFAGGQFQVEDKDGAQHTFDSAIIVDHLLLLKNTKRYAKEFPQNTFSAKLIKELEQIDPSPFAITRLVSEVMSRDPNTPEEAAVVFEDFRLYEKLFPSNPYVAHMLKVLEAMPGICEGTVATPAASAAVCKATFEADFGYKAAARTEEPKVDSKTAALIKKHDRISPDKAIIASFKRELENNTPICPDTMAKIIEYVVDGQVPQSYEDLAVALANIYVSGSPNSECKDVSDMTNLASGGPRSGNQLVDAERVVINPIKSFMEGSPAFGIVVKEAGNGAEVRASTVKPRQIIAKKLKQLDRNFPKNTIIARVMNEFEKQAFIPGDVMTKIVDECILNERGEELAVALANLYVLQQFDPQGQDPKSAAISKQIKDLEHILQKYDLMVSEDADHTVVVFGPGVSEEKAEAQIMERIRAQMHESQDKRFATLKKKISITNSSAEKPIDNANGVVKPLTGFLQPDLGVTVDLKGVARNRADTFWSSPEKILDTKGANLNASFRQGMERAAGAKINGMGISSPTKGAGTHKAGTLQDDEGGNGSEEGGLGILERPKLETKKSETTVKLGKKLTDLAIDWKKDLESKPVNSTDPTISSAESTTLANKSSELSIITVEKDPPNKSLVGFGTTIPELLKSLKTILANNSCIDAYTVKAEEGQSLTNFLNCNMVLLRLIHFNLKPEDYKEKTALSILSKMLWVALKHPCLSQEVRTTLLLKSDLWFIEEWQRAKGDLGVIKEQAKNFALSKNLVSMDFFDGYDARVAFTTAISKASSSTNQDAEEEIGLKTIDQESPMEQRVEGTSIQVENEDADGDHESMEYIEPSSLASATDKIISGVRAIKAEEFGKGHVDSILQSPTSPPDSPESTTTPEFVAIPTILSHSSPTTHRNISQNNIPPLTPPMTYDEIDSLPQAPVDLESIHTSLNALKSTLETINHSIHGAASDFPNESELVTKAKDTGLLLVTSYIGEWLKQTQLQISKLDTNLTRLDFKLGDMQNQNAGLGSKLADIQQRIVLGNVKGTENEELVRGVKRDMVELKMLVLGELKDVKAKNVMLVVRHGEMQKVIGEKEGEVEMWCEKVRELEEVIEEGEREGALAEVLWPQGDEVVRRKKRVDGEGRKIVVPKELYVRVGNEAGRGQGGGGFCVVM